MVTRSKQNAASESADSTDSTELAVRRSWGELSSAEDVKAALLNAFGTITQGKELLGNEFESGEKEKLLGVPFVILEYGFALSDKIKRNDQAVEYAWIRGINMNTMEKVAFSDGSTGIYNQLRDFYDRTSQAGGIYCNNGLRVSRYDYTDNEGTTTEAATFYLDN